MITQDRYRASEPNHFGGHSVKAIYSQLTVQEVYDQVFSSPEQEPETCSDEKAYPVKQALQWATRNGLVLECGCGPGRVLTHLSRRGCKVVGIDIHRRSLKALKKRHPEAMLVQADAASLPFKSQTFGSVLCFATLCYLPAGPEKGLKEIRRTLQPGGRVLTTMYHLNLIQLFQFLRFCLQPSRRSHEFLFWCVAPREWKRTLRACGFTPLDQAYTLYKWSLARYCPVLVKGGSVSYRQQRDGDSVPLNRFGILLWRLMSTFPRFFANHYYIASVLESA